MLEKQYSYTKKVVSLVDNYPKIEYFRDGRDKAFTFNMLCEPSVIASEKV